MPTDFTLPELGEQIAGGDVLRVLVAVGDMLVKDQPVLELETDKATIEVPSSLSGKVTAVMVKVGDKVKIGQVIASVEGAARPAAVAAAAPPSPAPPPAPEPAKAADVQRPAAAPPADAPRSAPAASRPSPPPGAATVAAPAAPSVRRAARELGVDINLVTGSGSGGRISVDDVKAYTKRLVQGITSGAAGGHAAPGVPLPDFTKWGAVERQPMRGVRRKTAEHLSAAWATIPHVTQHDFADITRLEEVRKKYKGQVEAAGGSLTVTAVAVKIVAAALKVFPQFNTSIDMAADEIIYKKFVHIGVAVNTDRGLLVPVIRDADQKNLTQLSVELNELSEKARNRKITLDEMQGGCFSISNLGGIGGSFFTPIVNAPEVAILGISRGSIEPVYDQSTGQFVPRQLLPLSLSYDHRVIDGADGIRFLRWIVEAFEQPFVLALHG